MVVTVAEELQKHAVARLVVDPVTISTSGDALATQVVWILLWLFIFKLTNYSIAMLSLVLVILEDMIDLVCAWALQGVVEAIQAHLMPIATIITPNILEASQFLGEIADRWVVEAKEQALLRTIIVSLIEECQNMLDMILSKAAFLYMASSLAFSDL